MVNKSDHVIKRLHPFLSMEFENCNGSAEKRLEVLFQIKDKWTKKELEGYLLPFIDLTVKFDAYIMKNTRFVKERNPFDPEIEVAYYLRKF